MRKPVYGTHYGEKCIMAGHITDMPNQFIEYFKPFKQTIYFNPLSPSGNFKFRLRHWYSNKHVPATNTGSDVMTDVFIDYDESGDLWTIDPITDRITGWYDYSEYVNEYYQKCLDEYHEGKLTVYEFYEKVYDCKVTVTFYIRNNERSMGLYPDDLQSLHAQTLNGRLGKDLTDIEMNIIFPKLTEISYDLLYNFTHVETKLFKDCDRLRFIDERQFDTLVDQTTLESWFENSGVTTLTNRMLCPMEKVTNIDNMCLNSGLKYLEYRAFYCMHYINTGKNTFANTDLVKIERELFEIDSSVPEVHFENMFSGSTGLNIYDGFKLNQYIHYDGKLYLENFFGGIIGYDTDSELLEGMDTVGNTNLIIQSEASTDTNGLNEFHLHYKCNKAIDIDSVQLAIVNTMGPASKVLEHTKELDSRIVIRTDTQTVAYDPNLKGRKVNELNIGKWNLKPGDVFDIRIYSANTSNIIGVYLNTKNNKGDIGPYYIDDEIQLTITGVIPKSTRICKMSLLYHELQYIKNTKDFFKNYSIYDVEGLFSELPYFRSLDENLLVPLSNQLQFNELVKGNRVIEDLPDVLSTNSKLRELNYAFSDMSSLTSFSINLLNNFNLYQAKGLFKNSNNLIINDTYLNILDKHTNLETVEEMFSGCKSLVSRISIHTLINCLSFKRMYYKCKNLVINDYEIEEILPDSNDLVKFGTIKESTLFDLPNYQNHKTIDLTEMYAHINIQDSIIYRKIKANQNIQLIVTDMWLDIPSLFTDKYLLNTINYTGNTGVNTIIPEQEFTVTLNSNTIELGSILTHFGLDKISNSTQIFNVSNSSSIWYPEYEGTIDIDWGDGQKQTLNINNTLSLFKKKKSNFKYARNANPEDENIITSEVAILDNAKEEGITILPISIEYYPKDKPTFSHRYNDSYIGKSITIKLSNRLHPLSIINGGTITTFKGSLPWSRLELLNLDSFKSCNELNSDLLKFTALSTNTRLKTSKSALFNLYNGKLIDVLHYNKNLRILDRLINNSLNNTFNNDIIVNLNKVLYMNKTFEDNINLNTLFQLPQSVRVMESVYSNTAVLTKPVSIDARNLRVAKYIFSNYTGNTVKVLNPVILNSINLYDITGFFKDSNIDEFSKDIFKNIDSIRIADETFMNTQISDYDDLLYTQTNLQYVNHILSGTQIVSFTNKLSINDNLIEANYAFHNCSKLTFISPLVINSNRKLRSIKHMLSKTPVINIPRDLIYGLHELTDASYMLSETQVNQLDPNFFKTNEKLEYLDGFFFRTPITLLHDDMLDNNTQLRSISYFISECMNMVNIPNLGIKVREFGSPFDFRSFAANSTNISFLQKKFTDIMLPFDPNTKPTLLIEDSLRGIKASYDDLGLTNNKFNIVGKSNAIYIPNPSTDTDGMNELTFDIEVKAGTTFTPVFKIFDYTKERMQVIKNASFLQKSNRVVIHINELVYGLDKRLDEPNNRQDFPVKELKEGVHTISIFTEPILNEFGNQTMGNAEVCIIDIDSDIPVRLSGTIPPATVDNKTNTRKLTLRGLFGIHTNIISVSNLKYNNYQDKILIPDRYFAYLNIRDINLDIIPFNKDQMLEQFIGCKNLFQVLITKPIKLDGTHGANLSKFFYDCSNLQFFPDDKPLSYYFNPIITEGDTKVINTPINFSYMFYNTKLTTGSKVLEFIDTDTEKYAFKNCFNYTDREINLEGMYSHSTVNVIKDKAVEIDVKEYRSKVPSYRLTNMYSYSKLVNVPFNCFKLNKCSNLTKFDYAFYEINTLTTLLHPIINMDWIYEYQEFDNEIDLEHMFGLSTNLKWERLTIKRIIMYHNEDNVPLTYKSYGMLENIISYVPDDKIFRGLVYTGETLSIYQNKGPDISGMNKFTMYYDMKSLIGSEYLFRIFGPTVTKDGYVDMTYKLSTVLNSKIYISVNDDLPNAIEYYPDEEKSISLITVTAKTENDIQYFNNEYNMREYNEPAICIKFDIYTDNNFNEIGIKELLGTVRPNLPDLVLGLRIEGPIGYSEIKRTSGLLLVDILSNIAVTKLYDISPDTFNNYTDYVPLKPADNDYHKALLSGIKGCDTLKEGVLHPFHKMTELRGILSDTAFKNISENSMKDFRDLTSFTEVFANAVIPNTINRNFLKPLIKLKDVTGFFYRATNTDVTVPGFFDSGTTIEIADYLYAYSDIQSTHVDMFRYLINLKHHNYGFYGTKLTGIANIYHYNEKIESLKSLLEKSALVKLPSKFLVNKNTLKYVDRMLANCEMLEEVEPHAIINSPNIDSANEFLYNTPKLKPVHKDIFESFRNCRFINSMFELSGIKEYTPNMMDNFISVIQAKNVFKNVKLPLFIPDEFLAKLTSAVTMYGMFEGEGALIKTGSNVLPVSTSLEDISNFFKLKRNIIKVNDEYFSNATSIKYMNNTYEECSSLSILPKNDKLVNLEEVKSTYRSCLSLTEIPDKYFYYNRKIHKFDQCFENDNKILYLGYNIINPDYTVVKTISTLNMMNGCTFSLNYNKIDKYIVGTENIKDQISINVEGMFNGAKTFFDETYVWTPVVNKIGNSQLTHTDPPSDNTDGLNMLGFRIPYTPDRNIKYKLMSINKNTVVNDTTAFIGRVVIKIDNTYSKAYDNQIFYGEKVEDINIPNDTNEHIVYIYTEHTDDVVMLDNMYKIYDSKYDNDTIELRKNDLPKVEILGGFSDGLSKIDNTTLYNLILYKANYTENQTVIPYPITKLSNTIIKSVTSVLPRINNDPKGGFFANLWCESYPDNLIHRYYNKSDKTPYEFTVGLFYNNTKLRLPNKDILTNASKYAQSLDYMYGNCISLTEMFNIIPINNVVTSLNYFTENCISLIKYANDFTSNLGNVSMNGFIKGCRKFTGFTNEFYTNIKGSILYMNEFAYDSGYTELQPKIIDVLDDVITMRYAFAKSKITKIPNGFFSKAKSFRIIDSLSPIEGVFSDISSLTTIEGNLGLLSAHRNITKLFSNSVNINWKNKRVSRVLYKALPSSIIVDDSFKNIHVNWDNDEQLFDPMKVIGKSNAIFDGRIKPSEDTTGLNNLTLHLYPINGTEYELQPLYVNSNKEIVDLLDTSELSGRIVVKLLNTDKTVIQTVAYDHKAEESRILPMIIPNNKETIIEIYTENDYIGFKVNKFNKVDLLGVLPPKAYIGDKVIPLSDMFAVNKDYTRISKLGSTLLTKTPATKLDLSNQPFNTGEFLTEVELGFFDPLIDQEILESQFENAINLISVDKNIVSKLTKLISIRNLFKNCNKLNMDITTFFKNHPNLEDISGSFSNTLVNKLSQDMFTILTKLKYARETFDNTKITSIPENLFISNKALVSIAMIFRRCPLTSLPNQLGLNLGCYSIERIFFECKSVSVYNHTIVDGLYNGGIPQDTISLIDAFYNVPVNFSNEAEFIKGIRFIQGNTGAIFKK